MRYLIVFTFTVVLFVSAIASFNWLIDPYGMYWSPQIENLNTLKPESGDRVRTTKPKRVLTVSPQTVLIGNSRIEMGVSSNSTLYDHKPIYNLGMPGIRLNRQMNSAARQIFVNNELKELIISLDYLDFVYDVSAFGEHDYTLNTYDSFTANTNFTIARAKEYLGFLISLNTSIDSINTMLKQGGQYNHIDHMGNNIPNTYLGVMRYEGIRPLFVQKIDEMRNRLDNPKRKFLMDSTSKLNPGIHRVMNLIDYALSNQIKVKLFINPYHYSYLHVLNEGGHFEDYLLWKQVLVKALEDLGPNAPLLWDFSGFNEVTLQKLEIRSKKPELSYYWEPAHYRAEVGELILAELYNERESGGFGRILHTENQAEWLAEDRQGLVNSYEQWQALEKYIYQF